MSDELDAAERVIKSSRVAWSHVGRWIARAQALCVAWGATYVILFFAAYRLEEQWAVWAIPVPIVVHIICLEWFKRKSKIEFGDEE